MVVFNYTSRELTTKVVYYGPGLCGKTTNLQFIYESMPQGVRGKMLSLATTGDRTLFFDFLPLDLGQIQGMTTKVQLYTVPGQVFYNETRRLVLKGADGIVFVADSQEKMLEANLDSFRNLEENLRAHGMDPADTPLVLQFNKRDLPDSMEVDRLNEALNRYNAPFYEAIATTGVGVQETLRHITKLVLLKLNERYADSRSSGKRTALSPPGQAPINIEGPADEAPLAMGGSSAPTGDPDFDLVAPAASELSAALPENPQIPAVEELAPAASAQNDIPTIAAPIAIPAPEAADLPSEAPAPEVESRSEAKSASRVASAAATLDGPDADDVLGRPEELARASMAPAEDEDVLGVAPAASEPAPPEPVLGTTVKIDRGDLSQLLEQEASAPVGPAPTAASARASLTEVSADDALFNEPGVQATRLVPGQPQEILVPLEIEEGMATRRFRLTLRLEIDS